MIRKYFLSPISYYGNKGQSGLEEAIKTLKSIVSEDNAFGRSFRFSTGVASEFNTKTQIFLAKGGRTTSDQVNFGVKKIQEVVDAYDKRFDELKFSPKGNNPRRVDCIYLSSHLGIYLKFGYSNNGQLIVIIHEDVRYQKSTLE